MPRLLAIGRNGYDQATLKLLQPARVNKAIMRAALYELSPKIAFSLQIIFEEIDDTAENATIGNRQNFGTKVK